MNFDLIVVLYFCSNKLCSPRVLSCLHVFCEVCIDKLMVNEAGDSLKYDLAVECPLCKQETKVVIIFFLSFVFLVLMLLANL